ncbi:hypothetical protein SPD48_14500 [Pseudogracilibacillus sp. SE30717A]|uniref:hypothetical protein n=1 Tax=Pseudogracilibacillus sp. SE30717A TaxID=3098293 RepID=UPI00300DF021
MRNVIKFKKTIVGWYNFTVAGAMRYNVDPKVFREITGISVRATLGTCEVSAEELSALKSEATYIGLADGWEIVPSDEQEVVAL